MLYNVVGKSNVRATLPSRRWHGCSIGLCGFCVAKINSNACDVRGRIITRYTEASFFIAMHLFLSCL